MYSRYEYCVYKSPCSNHFVFYKINASYEKGKVGTVREVLEYDTNNINDLMRALKRILGLIGFRNAFCGADYKNGKRYINYKSLIRYERYSKKYIFIFEDHEEEYSASFGRKLTEDNNLPGFFAVNRNDVVNLSYITRFKGNVIQVAGRQEKIIVSRDRRRELVKRFDL